MEPEQEDGMREYKLKLTGKTDRRIESIASQMRYRCEQGGTECIYNIGVEDDGTLTGITLDEYKETLGVLNSAANKNNYTVSLLWSKKTEDEKSVYEVLVRENNKEKYIDIKVTIAGNVDSGKSSFIGVITSGKFDDGRGSARLPVFNFPHEVKTGRTSSIGQHILGYDSSGKIVNYNDIDGKMNWSEIVKRSSKVISFFDLAGHEKYLKTTILGLSSAEPDVCFIMIAANKGIRSEKNIRQRGKKKKHENMTREHIFLCILLKIPFVIIITKIDMVEERKNVLKETMSDIHKIIKSPGSRRQPIQVKTDDDVLICAKQTHTESIVPIFTISNVSGFGIDKIQLYLNVLGKTRPKKIFNDVEYRIDSTWTISGVGSVLGGHLITGTIKVGDNLLIGPNNGKYEQVVVRSIHCKRVPLQSVSHGSYVCLGLKKYNRKNIRRGNVLLSNILQQVFCEEFVAEVKVIQSHSTTIRIGYEPVIHVSVIRQTAVLVKIENKVNSRKTESMNDSNDDILRTGDKATATFRMRYQPEYIVPGMRILLSEGKTKCVGIVKSINPKLV